MRATIRNPEKQKTRDLEQEIEAKNEKEKTLSQQTVPE